MLKQLLLTVLLFTLVVTCFAAPTKLGANGQPIIVMPVDRVRKSKSTLKANPSFPLSDVNNVCGQSHLQSNKQLVLLLD